MSGASSAEVPPLTPGWGRWVAAASGHRRLVTTIGLPLLVYLLLVLSGITTSNIGNPHVRADLASGASTLGMPKDVRTDEFVTLSPLLLGQIATGGTEFESPLAMPDSLVMQVPTSGVATSIVFFDGLLTKLGPVVPDRWVFAAIWWMPWLLLVWFGPPLLRLLGARSNLAWLATSLIALNPATQWWSYTPVKILGPTMAGCYLVARAVQGSALRRSSTRWRRVALLGQGAAGAVLLARLPTGYVPWQIVLGGPVVLATLVHVWAGRTARLPTVLYSLGFGCLSVLLIGVAYWENWPSFRAQAESLYPGHRRVGGATMEVANLLAAPSLGSLQGQPALISSNYSEVSSAYTVSLLVAVGVALLVPLRWRRRSGPALIVLGACSACWLAWCTLPWGSFGAHIPILNLVTPKRAAAVVGILGCLLIALLLSRIREPVTGHRRARLVRAGAVGAAGAVVSWWGGISLRNTYVPSLSNATIAVSSIALALAVAGLVAAPRRWAISAAVLVLAAIPVATVNPVQIGLGDLRDSTAARQMLQAGTQARADGTRWASDDWFSDALLAATGVPTINGHMMSGPNRDTWQVLDPTDAFEQAWNRASSYIWMDFQHQGPLTITSPKVDVVVIQVDPCDPVLRQLGVADLMSTRELNGSCLTAAGTLDWSGRTEYLYSVR